MSNEMQFPDSCIVHMSRYDEDCDACQVELVAIKKQGLDTDKETITIVNQLGLSGYETDPLMYVAIRLDTLIDSILSGNVKARAKFDTTVSVNVLREMVRLQAEAVRESLLS